MSIEQISNGSDEAMPIERLEDNEETPEEEIKKEEGGEQLAFEVGQLVKSPGGGKLYINSIDVERGRAFLSNLEPGQEGAVVAAEDVSLSELAKLQRESNETAPTSSNEAERIVAASEKTPESEKTKKAKLMAANLHNLFGQYIGEYTISEDMTNAEEDINKMLEMIGESFPEEYKDQLELLNRLRSEQENGELAKRFEEII